MLRQMVRAGRLDPSFYTSLVYDRYAAGNAVLIVAVVGALRGLGSRSFLAVGWGAVSGIMRAAMVALAVWAAGVHLCKREGQIPDSFRLVGFANIALLPMAVEAWTGSVWIRSVLTILAAVWFFLALRAAGRAQFGLDRPEDGFAAAAGVLAWYVGEILL